MPASEGVTRSSAASAARSWPPVFDELRLSVDARFPGEPSSVPRARVLAVGAVQDRPVGPDLATVVSELAANAVRHAGTPFRLQVAVIPGAVLVRVDDENPAGAFDPPGPSPSEDPVDAPGGRGLALVAALADSWGIRRSDLGGTCVWAVLAS